MNIETDHAAHGGHDSLLTPADIQYGQLQWMSLFAATGLELIHMMPALRDHLIACKPCWDERVAAMEIPESMAEELFIEQVRQVFIVAFAMRNALWS